MAKESVCGAASALPWPPGGTKAKTLMGKSDTKKVLGWFSLRDRNVNGRVCVKFSSCTVHIEMTSVEINKGLCTKGFQRKKIRTARYVV